MSEATSAWVAEVAWVADADFNGFLSKKDRMNLSILSIPKIFLKYGGLADYNTEGNFTAYV